MNYFHIILIFSNHNNNMSYNNILLFTIEHIIINHNIFRNIAFQLATTRGRFWFIFFTASSILTGFFHQCLWHLTYLYCTSYQCLLGLYVDKSTLYLVIMISNSPVRLAKIGTIVVMRSWVPQDHRCWWGCTGIISTAINLVTANKIL